MSLPVTWVRLSQFGLTEQQYREAWDYQMSLLLIAINHRLRPVFGVKFADSNFGNGLDVNFDPLLSPSPLAASLTEVPVPHACHVVGMSGADHDSSSDFVRLYPRINGVNMSDYLELDGSPSGVGQYRTVSIESQPTGFLEPGDLLACRGIAQPVTGLGRYDASIFLELADI